MKKSTICIAMLVLSGLVLMAGQATAQITFDGIGLGDGKTKIPKPRPMTCVELFSQPVSPPPPPGASGGNGGGRNGEVNEYRLYVAGIVKLVDNLRAAIQDDREENDLKLESVNLRKEYLDSARLIEILFEHLGHKDTWVRRMCQDALLSINVRHNHDLASHVVQCALPWLEHSDRQVRTVAAVCIFQTGLPSQYPDFGKYVMEKIVAGPQAGVKTAEPLTKIESLKLENKIANAISVLYERNVIDKKTFDILSSF